MKKGIIIAILTFLIVGTTIVITKNIPKYIMQDGMMLALTLDDTPITSFPERGKYDVAVDCGDTATGKWLAEEWKLAIEDITDEVKCNISFNSSPASLKSEVESTSTPITIEQEMLDEESYTIAHIEPLEDNTPAFIWDSTAKTWTSQNHTDNVTKGMKFVVPKGYYQLCYTMSSESNYDYGIVYIDGVEKFNTKGKNSSSFVCEDLGQMYPTSVVQVVYRKDVSVSSGNDNIVFYLQPKITSYRYSGKQPNNWIWFNGEKWRIIGSIPTIQSDGTENNLVKIIREEPLGTYVYDAKESNYTGSWGNNTLYSFLNIMYFNSENGLSHAGCYSAYPDFKAKPNCIFTETGLDSSSYYREMVKEVYWNTGASDYFVTPGEAYLSEITNQTVTGYVGLMSASDWGYAASRTNYDLPMGDYGSIIERSWLFNYDFEWTLTKFLNEDNTVLFVSYSSAGLANSEVNSGYTVRPVVYLDSSVYVIYGDGTEGNPYQIGM